MINFLLNFHCVIIHWHIDIKIEYFLEKVLNFDIFFLVKKKKSVSSGPLSLCVPDKVEANTSDTKDPCTLEESEIFLWSLPLLD